jgi:mannose-6-phosphate isomerase-like protein (cupin superfamily)
MSMKVVNVLDAIEFNPEKMKKVSLFDTDHFFCDIYCLEPGQSQKVHSHDGSDKVYYVMEGKGKVTVGSEEKVLTQNEITMAPSGQDHGVLNHSNDKLVLLVFMAPKPH